MPMAEGESVTGNYAECRKRLVRRAEALYTQIAYPLGRGG